jgi:uncharacterized membrane protein (UPF0136 family)
MKMREQQDGPIERLTEAVDKLAVLLEQTNQRYLQLQRSQRRMRLGMVAVAVLLLVSALRLLDGPRGESRAAPPAPQASAAGETATRLTPAEQAELADFQLRLAKMRTALATLKEGDAPALVALFLHDMSRSLKAMPEMLTQIEGMNNKMSAIPFMAAQVRDMNAKMTAVPAMAGEMRAMSAKMGLMTAGIDSTMGRMGRFMSWWPW